MSKRQGRERQGVMPCFEFPEPMSTLQRDIAQLHFLSHFFDFGRPIWSGAGRRKVAGGSGFLGGPTWRLRVGRGQILRVVGVLKGEHSNIKLASSRIFCGGRARERGKRS